MEARATTPRQLAIRAEREVRLLRALLGLAAHNLSYPQRAEVWAPSCPIPPVAFYHVFHRKTGLRTTFHDALAALLSQKYGEPVQLRGPEVAQAAGNHKAVRELPNEIREAMIEPLVLYQEALDAALVDRAFLGLWQTIEALWRLGDHHARSDYDKITRDTAALIASTLDGSRHADSKCLVVLLQGMKNKRHDWVHASVSAEDRAQDCNLLRHTAVCALSAMLSLAKGFKEVEVFREYVHRLRRKEKELEDELVRIEGVEDAVKQSRFEREAITRILKERAGRR